jgi:hypothetical protein
METRADRYIAKESEPFFQLPKFEARPGSNRFNQKVSEVDAAFTESVNKKGYGGAFAASPAATYIKERADKINSAIPNIDTGNAKLNPVVRTAAKPVGWIASLAKAAVTATGLRQQERDARVAAVRKQMKEKKDKQTEALEKLAAKEEKDAENKS